VQCGLGTEAEDLERRHWAQGTSTAEGYMKLEALEAVPEAISLGLAFSDADSISFRQ